jgi:aspartate-semialdehyde dehydrogenase
MKKIRVGILGATGMVGQRFVTLLANHPWFEITSLAASPRSAGKSYAKAVENRWKIIESIPNQVKNFRLKAVEEDSQKIIGEVDLVFSALDLDKEKIKEIENHYAQEGIAVVSNNSAHRWTEDVPIIIPEINPNHLSTVDWQRKRRGWKKGLVVVKPNCSLQSYLPIVYVLRKYLPTKVSVTTLQAISGSGKTFQDWPEMADNVIPFISGEEEKTENEQKKILGTIKNGKLIPTEKPIISATCIRVPVSDGHMASISIKFQKPPTFNEIVEAISNFQNPLVELNLPSAPEKFIHFFGEDNRPQTKLDRDSENGMSISCGRLRPDPFFDWKLIGLSHNTIRGAAGGAILTAELLVKKGYLQ